MFKDYDKYLTTSLKVYLFVLIIIFIMKIVGLDYFGLDLNNPTITNINNFCLKWHLENLWYLFTYYIYVKVIIGLSINKEQKFNITFPISILSLCIMIFVKPHMSPTIYIIFDYVYLLLIIFILNKFKNKVTMIKRYTLVVLLNILFQSISLFIRSVGKNDMYFDNFLLWQLLNFDYVLLSIISYKCYFMKGEVKLWVEVSLSSLKKMNLKNLLKKLQKNWHNFQKQSKVEKLTFIIYFIFSLIWNTLSLVIILLVAKLNDTFIECIFILTSFWLSKRAFGKPFHLPSMAQCFIVSNLSYYALNRLTTPLGISIIIPILLGVGLSYVTSKLVKKTYKPLYRGMPEELFEETILKVVDKNSDKYKICYDFYINKKSVISLSMKYNYTESGIRKIKDRVNEKIKRLD